MDGANISLNVEEIVNNRDVDTLSGDISLELWATAKAYEGEGFSGYALASVALGQLNGQYGLQNCHYSLAIAQPPEGLWNLVLMLREWDNGVYVTRDFINFPQRVRSHYQLMLSLDGLPALVP